MCTFVYVIQYCIDLDVYSSFKYMWIIFLPIKLRSMDFSLLKVLIAMNCPLLKALTGYPLRNIGASNCPSLNNMCPLLYTYNNDFITTAAVRRYSL